MIHILKKYYTKAGRIVIPLSFTGVAYDCQYSNGNKVLLKADELFEENPRKKVKAEKPTAAAPSIEVVPEFIFEDDNPKEELNVDDLVKEIEEVSDDSEKEVKEIPKNTEKPVDKIPKKQDNIKETADDFYADFM